VVEENMEEEDLEDEPEPKKKKGHIISNSSEVLENIQEVPIEGEDTVITQTQGVKKPKNQR